jgi:sugar/nucleoside kinase (ribokinase family)
MRDHDVYSFGVVSSSTLYSIKGPFPAEEGYAEIASIQHMVGGEAANSSIVLARLGASVKLDGNWIGADDAGRRAKAILDGFEIDTSRLPLREGYAGVHEAVFASRGNRTIFGTYVRLQEEEAWNTPVEDDVRRAKVVCLDPFFGHASNRVAEIAFDARVPVITIDCPPGEALVGCASATVVSESYIKSQFASRPVEGVFDDYVRATRGVVVFTFGDRGAWYARPGSAVRTAPAYAVDAVDTSCAGDSFRAGIVFGLLNGWEDARTIDFASALAAIVCTRTPGALNSPSLAEVTAFMRSRRGVP